MVTSDFFPEDSAEDKNQSKKFLIHDRDDFESTLREWVEYDKEEDLTEEGIEWAKKEASPGESTDDLIPVFKGKEIEIVKVEESVPKTQADTRNHLQRILKATGNTVMTAAVFVVLGGMLILCLPEALRDWLRKTDSKKKKE